MARYIPIGNDQSNFNTLGEPSKKVAQDIVSPPQPKLPRTKLGLLKIYIERGENFEMNMSHVLWFTVPNLNQKELIPPVKNTSSPVWSIVREFPIYKSEIEQVPEIIVDSIDSINSKILQTFNLNIWDLVLSNKDISEVPLKSYALTP